MKKIKMLLGALVFFCLGFVASEYYRYTGVPRNNVNFTSNDDSRVKNDLTIAVNKTIVDDALAGASVQHDDNIDRRLQTNKFSWERVNKLIADENYDDAVGLLRSYLETNATSVQAWFLLAQVYQKQKKHQSAFDAWFHYLGLERDTQKIDSALKHIKNYLLQLSQNPAMFGEDFPWLIAQLDKFLNISASDGELQLSLANLYLKVDDTYQAQYHALMAVNDPAVQKRAEEILAKLNGKNITDEISIPLSRFGNQYLINVSIEGHSARLLLDTGASLSGVSKSYAENHPAIIKAKKPIRLNTASGVEDSFLFTVDNLSFGNLVFDQHILALLPMDNAGEFDGLLGVDILGRFDFVIDQDASLLRLRARKNR